MAPAQTFVLIFLLSATLAEDDKLRLKTATKPVRLFTEEELKRYDGTEVTPQRGVIDRSAQWVCCCVWVIQIQSLYFVVFSGGAAHLHGSKRCCL